MREELDQFEPVGRSSARPTRATLIGLLVGTSLAIVAAMGPLVSAITITVGVETQVGDASGLPDARMLPAAWRAWALSRSSSCSPGGRLVAYAPGAPSSSWSASARAWPPRGRTPSGMTSVSGLATLHLVVKMAEDLIATIRLLVADDALAVAQPRLSPNGTRLLSAPNARVDGRVLRMVRANPLATWKVVKDRTGLSEANAKRALTAARRKLRDAVEDVQVPGALEQGAAHPNGSRT
jgi:hypothetical protein